MDYQTWLTELAELFECSVEGLQQEISTLYYLWKSGTSVREAYDIIKHHGVA